MTQAQIAAVTAAVIAALNTPKKDYGKVAKRPAYRNPRISKADVEPSVDRALKRRSAIGKGFARKGIKVTFVNETGRFDNVKPFKTWLLEGRVVRKGEHGIRGLFHISQTDTFVPPVVQNMPANVQIGQSV